MASAIGRIDFAYAGTPAALLDLRGVDDIYVHAARLTGLDHTRASLARLTEKIAPMDLLPALEVCAAVRPISTAPTYRVTASHLGRRNYSRYDVESAVATALTGNLPWRFVLNDAEEQEPELDLRVLLEDDWALLGLRLGALPLHRRAYKVASRPGSLKPPVAYCLGLLAALAPGDVVLDPACGAGTILVEAAALVPSGVVCGGDLDPSALETAQANLQAAGMSAVLIELSAGFDPRRLDQANDADQPIALLYQGDATDLRLADRTRRCGAVEPALGQAGDRRNRSGAAVPWHPGDDRARAGARRSRGAADRSGRADAGGAGGLPGAGSGIRSADQPVWPAPDDVCFAHQSRVNSLLVCKTRQNVLLFILEIDEHVLTRLR